MKTVTSVTLDGELLGQLKDKGENVSATLNSLLKEYLGPKKESDENKKEINFLLDTADAWGEKFEYVKFVYDTLDRDFKGVIEMHKDKFTAEGSMEHFARIRRKLRECLETKEEKLD